MAETLVMDTDSESDESDIVDPFDKYHKYRSLHPAPGKYVSKIDVIKKAARSFTEEFKLMREMCDELNVRYLQTL